MPANDRPTNDADRREAIRFLSRYISSFAGVCAAIDLAETLALEERRPWAATESDRRDWDYQDYLEKNPIMERPLPWAKALAAMKERSE